MHRRRLRLLLAAAAVTWCCAATANGAAAGPFVMLISVDGLKPEAVLDAERHGLKVPQLRAFLDGGMYSTGVRGVLPSLTYPSHTTLLTGVSPSKHGIYANITFDPMRRNDKGWYWYAEDVKVATLWDAAAAAHLTTANVYWPTSVGARITYNLPQIWRTGTDDDLKLQRVLGTPGLERELSTALGRYPGGMEETVADDETRARFAIHLLRIKHPDFITVYFTGLDSEQHKSGPFSPESNATLERVDALIGGLRAAAQEAAPGRATVCVVSDHGFAPVAHDVHLFAAFLKAGLFRVDDQRKISGWKAMLWQANGSAAVMLADPADEAVRTQVQGVLKSLAADPANGIDRVLTHDEILRRGGFPDAAFLVSFKIGFELSPDFTPPFAAGPENLGNHGYLPDRPEMRSSFFMIGPRAPAGRSLGEIDMRQIAPTVAKILNLKLPDAELGPLPLN